ncbi:MAG: YdbH family protein, partial [Enterobacteriaceae bacterium]
MMRKAVRIVTIALPLCLLCVVLLTITLPRWLPPLVRVGLPEALQLQLATPKWSWQQRGLLFPSVQLSNKSGCAILQLQQASLSLQETTPIITIADLQADSRCLPASTSSPAQKPLLWRDLWRWLVPFSLTIDSVKLQPWPEYSGRFSLKQQHNQAQLQYQGTNLNSDITITPEQININVFSLVTGDQHNSIDAKGSFKLPATLEQLPTEGSITGGFFGQSLPYLFDFALNWQGNSGQLTLQEQESKATVLSVPWQWHEGQFTIEQGKWFWPLPQQPLGGMLSLSLKPEGEKWNQVKVTARANMLTQGKWGKGNIVLTAGPEVIGSDSHSLPVQLTGGINLRDIVFTATIPAMLSGKLPETQLELQSGALLLAKGQVSRDITLQELRLPLAGIRLTSQGINGRLQAIMRVKDALWGSFRLHMDGLANDFTPDSGLWRWKYWGEGQIPLFAARWDINGQGHWQDSLLQFDKLSTGFDRLRYGNITLRKPRLQLQTPLQWRRDRQNPSLSGDFLFTSGKTRFPHGAYLPPFELKLALKGRTPADFLWNAALRAGEIGPIKGGGRWDGERLRGQVYWPQQPLQVFQPLLAPDLRWKIRSGSLYAQMAFSASPADGLQAGGHAVVKQGAMWLNDGELSGLDFVLPLRLKD